MVRETTDGSRGHRPSIGLALGSCSARGLAHLGVIRAVEDAGVKSDCIAGTSMGALIGAIYAAGNLKDLETTFLAFGWKRIISFFDLVLPRSGLIDGARVSDLVRDHVLAAAIEGVRASIPVPGIFTGAWHILTARIRHPPLTSSGYSTTKICMLDSLAQCSLHWPNQCFL